MVGGEGFLTRRDLGLIALDYSGKPGSVLVDKILVAILWLIGHGLHEL